MSTSATLQPARLMGGYSLEMTAKDIPALNEASPILPSGTRINVTFLGNEDLEMRVAAAAAVRERGFIPIPHISARRLVSDRQLREFLGRLRDVGATEHIFVVGGDPDEPAGPFEDSLSVISSGILADYGVREVSIAGYPEGHPGIAQETLRDHLVRKTSALADNGLDAVILTQFAFDTDPVVEWIQDVRSLGITAPIRVGTPGPAGIRRLLGFARRFGVGANAMIVKKYGFSLTNLLGTAGPDRFIADLASHLPDDSTDVAIHLYTFGGLRESASWAEKFLSDAAN